MDGNVHDDPRVLDLCRSIRNGEQLDTGDTVTVKWPRPITVWVVEYNTGDDDVLVDICSTEKIAHGIYDHDNLGRAYKIGPFEVTDKLPTPRPVQTPRG